MKVLIVDDILYIRKLLSTKLIKMGHQVIEAVNGEEAVTMAQIECPDVIFMDIVMPKLDGIEATRRIKQLGITTKVVMCTVASDKHKVIEAMQAGASDYIVKPLSDERLAEAVYKALQNIQNLKE